jgi:hypothetical protein
MSREDNNVLEEIQIQQQRMDETWNINLEDLAQEWSEICIVESRNHLIAGYSTQKSHNRYGMTTVIVPIVSLAITTIIGIYLPDSELISVIAAIGFMLGSIASAVYKWLNLGEITQLHWRYESEYKALSLDIAHEMARERNYRKSADTFMDSIRGKMQHYESSSPPLPKGNSCFGCEKWKYCNCSEECGYDIENCGNCE